MSENAPPSRSDLDHEPLASQLIEPDQGWIIDEEADLVAREAAGPVGELTAEEAAVHVTAEDDAPGLTWDRGPGYVDEDPSEPPSGS